MNSHESIEQFLIKILEQVRKAAEKGHADAQYFMSLYYSIGLGVPKDTIESVSWCLRAAAGGSEKARNTLFKHDPCLRSIIARGEEGLREALSLLALAKALDRLDRQEILKELDHLKNPEEENG